MTRKYTLLYYITIFLSEKQNKKLFAFGIVLNEIFSIYFWFSCHIMYTVVCMIISHSNLHKIIIKSIKDIKWSSRSFFILLVHFPKSISVTITFLFLLFNYSLVIFPLTFFVGLLLLFNTLKNSIFYLYYINVCVCVHMILTIPL